MLNWLEITLMTETSAIDVLCAMLTDCGIKGFVTQDKESFQEFLEDKSGKWDYIDDDVLKLSDCETSITFYLPDDAQGAEQFASVKNLLDTLKLREDAEFFGSLDLRCGQVKEEDWANNWKQYFKPFPVGEKLYIKPSWETIPENTQRTILEIDPASSFGTGQHHTTRLCLELSESVLRPHDKILDLGCGSGILSIGAVLLGADYAAAVDIVDNSVKTALDNARKNHLSPEQYQGFCGDICSDNALKTSLGTGYHLIYANIVADVLKAMAGLFPDFLAPEGHLIVSGIISEREQEVLSVLESYGFRTITRKEKEGWSAALLSLN